MRILRPDLLCIVVWVSPGTVCAQRASTRVLPGRLASTPDDSSQGGGSPPPARAPTPLRVRAPRPACADAVQHREAAQHDACARASAPMQHCAARGFSLGTICIGAAGSRHCTLVQIKSTIIRRASRGGGLDWTVRRTPLQNSVRYPRTARQTNMGESARPARPGARAQTHGARARHGRKG